MIKRLLSLLLVLCTLLSALPTAALADSPELITSTGPQTTEPTVDPENPFTDVDEDDWCYDAVQYVRVNGIFNGTVNNFDYIWGGTFNGTVINYGDILNTDPERKFTLGENFSIENDESGTIDCEFHIWKDGICRLCAYVCEHPENVIDATCTSGPICYDCLYEYGEPLGHTPVEGSYEGNGNGTHSFTCTVCGTVTEEHTYGD